MLYGIKIEICAGSLEDIRTAEKYSEVDRVEVNSHLEHDGLSMDHDDFLEARKISSKQLMSMVRPRAGSFIYTEDEKEKMLEEAQYFMAHGADGIVFGCLTEQKEIDVPFTEAMIKLIHSEQKEAVFHKAFDKTSDFFKSAQVLADLHCDRILTSAGKPDCSAGSEILHALEEQYETRIQILPGGGINAGNLLSILHQTGCTRFHMSLRAADPEQKLVDVLEALRASHHSQQHILTGEDQEMFEEDRYEETMEPQEDTHDHE